MIARAAAAASVASLALLVTGCGLAPYADETLPAVGQHEVRITEGAESSAGYQPSVDVTPPSEVQFLTEIADGKTVLVTVPRGPAPELTVEVTVEGAGSEPVATSTLRSETGEPLVAGSFFEYDPGYLGIEELSDDQQLTLRIAAPRLTGTPQGRVPFTFKLRVR